MNDIERNDLWLNVKGNYIYFTGNFFDFIMEQLAYNFIINSKRCNSSEFLPFFLDALQTENVGLDEFEIFPF